MTSPGASNLLHVAGQKSIINIEKELAGRAKYLAQGKQSDL